MYMYLHMKRVYACVYIYMYTYTYIHTMHMHISKYMCASTSCLFACYDRRIPEDRARDTLRINRREQSYTLTVSVSID